MRRSRMVVAFALAVVLVVLPGGIARAQIDLEPVVTGTAEQYFGFANDSHIVYTQWTRRTGERALAQPLDGGPAIRLNTARTEGLTGGFDPGTNRVIYQQFSRERGRSDLLFYDLDTGERSKVPGVNTRAWEYIPRISSTFIAFQRATKRGGTWYASLRVFHRLDQETRQIGRWREGPPLFVSSVGDHYVTYTRCTNRNQVPGACSAYLYDWETHSQAKIPTVNARPQYAAAVDEANSAIYYARLGARCGRGVSIWRRPILLADGDAETKIMDLPRGFDPGFTASLTANGQTGHMDLYLEQWDCARSQNDIYVARGVDAEPMP